jgi:hypothetical protein
VSSKKATWTDDEARQYFAQRGRAPARKATGIRQYPEQDLQIKIVKNYYTEFWPLHGGVLYSTGVEGKARSRGDGRRKAMGVLAGIPDLHWVFRGQVVFLELKWEDGRVRETQSDFMSAVTHEGLHCYVVRSEQEAKEIFSHYLHNHENGTAIHSSVWVDFRSRAGIPLLEGVEHLLGAKSGAVARNLALQRRSRPAGGGELGPRADG